MNIVPSFSFKYKGRPFDIADAKVVGTEYGRRYELPDGLTVEMHIEAYPEYSAVKWMLWFENRGARDTGIISDIRDCDAAWCFMDGPGRSVKVSLFDTTGNTSYESYLTEEDCSTEYSVHEKVLSPGVTAKYHPLGGRSASGQMPFFELFAADKKSVGNGYGAACSGLSGAGAVGNGLFAAIGWSGQWTAAFTRKDGDIIGIQTGLDYTAFRLHPGERVRTSSILLMDYTGDRVYGSNRFRRLIKERFCPYSMEQLPFALEGMGMPAAKHLFHIEQFKQHGVSADYYWIDAGWYGKGGAPGAADWYKQVGNWQVRPDEHPEGLVDVVNAARDAGMKFLLWFEPERVYPGTDLAVAHPEWLYPLDGFYLLLRLDNDDVREYLFEMLSGFIERLDIRCLRLDFNMEPLQSWRITDNIDRGGINEIKYIMNLYRLWDELRARFPGLIIDNCASGGRRIDIESLSRTVPVWRTDAYCEFTRDPDVIQTQMFGFNRLIPCSGGVCKKLGDTYATRSAYAPAYVGSWWWTDRPTPTEDQFAWMKKMCDEYRRLRPYFSCDFYPLENAGWSYAHGGWAAYRYDRPEHGDGIIMAFRRAGSNCETARYLLPGLPADNTYTVTDLDTGASSTLSGLSLSTSGLLVTIEGQYQSKVLLYKTAEAAEAAEA